MIYLKLVKRIHPCFSAFFSSIINIPIQTVKLISTNTGFNPFCTIGVIVVGNPTQDTIISSPS